MRPSLIATDLDGTFLGADGQVSAENRRAVVDAHALGIPVVVATGRPARWLQPLAAIREAEPWVLTSNGACVYDLAGQRIVESFPVPVELVLGLADRMREACPDAVFGVEYGIEYAREEGYPVRGDFVEAVEVGRLEDLVGRRDVVKLLVLSRELTSDQLAQRLAPVVGTRLTATWSVAGEYGLLEVSAAGITKAFALARLAEQLGVDVADAVAFGDMPNDLEMLHLVGHPYVMADCHPLLRQTGYPEAGPHDESGVGRTIERLLSAG